MSDLDVPRPPRPYPGLRPFERDEWPIFFGRERMTDEVVERTLRDQVVVIHGDSGCGKSSLIRAGVLPRFELESARADTRWQTCSVVPGGDVLARTADALSAMCGANEAQALELRRALRLGKEAPAELARLVRDPNTQVCVLLDQFEEVFTQARASSDGAAEVRALIELLIGIQKTKPAGLYFILTMRSEFLGACAQFEGFAEAVNAVQYLVPRMSREDVVRAIREPAALYGGSVSRALAESWAEGVGAQDHLPLLQHALMVLHGEAIAKAGSNEGWRIEDEATQLDPARLLDDHATQTMERCGAPASVVEHVFRALADVNAEGHAIRRPQTLADLAAVAGGDETNVRAVIDAFRAEGVSFIRPYGARELTDSTVVDVSHEALIRCWSKVSAPKDGWLAREVEDGLVWRTLSVEANAFEADASNVLSPAVTEARRAWMTSRNDAWSRRYGGGWTRVANLVSASVRHHEEEKERKAAAQKRATRWLSLAVVIMAVAIAALIALYLKADEAEQRAVALSAENFGRAASALAREPGQEIEAASLALRGYAIGRWSPELHRGADEALEAIHSSMPLRGHSASVFSAVFSPDGTRVVTASKDNTARIWDASSAQLIATLQGHSGSVLSSAFSSDGTKVVTASSDSTARVWDASSGKLIATLQGHTGSVLSAAFSPDGNRVATASWDKTARIWEASSAKLIATLQGHTDAVLSSLFSSDGTRIVTASEDNTRIWDAASATLIATLLGSARSAAFSSDGTRVLTASRGSTARVWDVASANVIALLQGDTYAVQSAVFSNDGTRVVVASADAARVWDAASAKLIATLEGHGGPLSSAAFSSDGKMVVTASEDNTARVWDAASSKLIAMFQGHSGPVLSAAFSNDRAKIVTASSDHTARIWVHSSAKHIASLRAPAGLVLSAAFSNDGIRIVTASSELTTGLVWDPASAEPIATLQGHTGWVRSAAFSGDGTRVVTASLDSTARVWNVSSAKLIATLQGHSLPVLSAAFSNDGAKIVTASMDYSARVWDASSAKLIADLRGHTGSVLSAAFSYDGSKVVTASFDDTARVWDASSAELIATLRGHTEQVKSAEFSNDGARIITASADETARIWDASSAKPIATLQGHTDAVRSAAFSKDGTRIVTTSDDETARIWDASSAKLIATFQGHTGPVLSAAFSDDGTRLLTASKDDTARIWDVRFEFLAAELCKKLRFQPEFQDPEITKACKKLGITSTSETSTSTATASR